MTKLIVLGAFVFVSIALGGLLVQEKQQAGRQSAQSAALQAQVVTQKNEIQRVSAAAADLEQKRAQLVARAKAARQSLLEARNAAASAPAVPADPAASGPASADADGKKKPGNPFTDSIAKMMKDPAMKNMMRVNQATVLKQMYGDLVKQWALSPEESKTFYDLLLDKQMDQMDQGMKVMEKGPDAASAAASGESDAKIKAALGDDLYKQYQDYEKTIGERFTVNQLQQQLAVSNATPMTPDQSNVLLHALAEEKANMPPGSMTPPTGGGGNPFSMDPARVDQYMQAQSQLNDKVDARMSNVLSPAQLQVFKDQQQQMLAAQRVGMEMATRMMGPSPTP